MTMTGEAFALTCACDWLRTAADAAAKGEVTLEVEMSDGRNRVSEEWPSRLAFLQHTRNLETLKAMVEHSRLAPPAGQSSHKA